MTPVKVSNNRTRLIDIVGPMIHTTIYYDFVPNMYSPKPNVNVIYDTGQLLVQASVDTWEGPS